MNYLKRFIVLFVLCFVGILVSCDQLNTDFKPVSITIIIDSSASNQENLEKEIKFIKRLCAFLDPSDEVSIFRTSESVYLIYQGKPNRPVPLTKALSQYTALDENEKGTAYGKALNRAFKISLQAKKDGYEPAILIIGDMEDEYVQEGNINWDLLPEKVQKIQEDIPDITFAFFFAHPKRLDFIHQKLYDILGKRLIISPETNTNEALKQFLEKINR